MKTHLLLAFIAFIQLSANAQTGRKVSGSVKDSTGKAVSLASVRLLSAQDTLTSGTNTNGEFTFVKVRSSSFVITVTSLGFQSASRKYAYADGASALVLNPILLNLGSKLLNEVAISGEPVIVIKEDTIEYKASDYKLRENALAEDLLKKLPGLEVDKDGNVKAQGKAITKVRVNGKDFFGGDVKTATQQLPADIIDKIQIVDDYGDQANISGIKNGDPEKILNIEIRPDKNRGYFARGALGGGNKERYQASVNANSFKDKQQISFIGNLNNTNSSVFNFNGPGGGGGGQRVQIIGGGGRGGGFGGNGATGDGITLVGSAGLNYRDEWSKKLSSYGSYSFSNRENDVLSNQLLQNNFQNSLILNDQNNSNNTLSSNHRLNYNLEYRPDSLNFIKISPNFSFSGTESTGFSSYTQLNNAALSSAGVTSSNSASDVPNVGGNLLFNHRFAKRGRNVSVNLSVNNSETDQQRSELNQYTNYTNSGDTEVYRNQYLDIINRSSNSGANFSYNEPLTRTSNLELSYNFNYTKYRNERQTFDVDQQANRTLNQSLTNDYDYSFTTNRVGLNYRVNKKKYNYSLGGSVQPTLLSGTAVIGDAFTVYKNTGLNFVPTARFSYNFSRTRSFNASYFGRSNEPSYNQLQPIPDVSNPQYSVFGNPNLNAEFNHRLNLRYNNFEFNTGNVLFTNLSASFTNNKVVSNIVRRNDPAVGLVQETRYLNTDGFFTLNGFYNYSKPFAEKKYVVSVNGSATFNNNISFSDGNMNTGKNWILTQGLNTQINPVKWLEVNPGFTYSYNTNSNDLITNTNTKVSTYGISFNSKTYFLKTFLIGVDLDKTFNSGYSSLLAANPFIINSYLEKQFLKNKNATLRLQSFDLLDQNTSVSRSVTANAITDSRSNRLSRYFMLSLNMRLQKFNGQQTQAPMPGRERIEIRRDGNF